MRPFHLIPATLDANRVGKLSHVSQHHVEDAYNMADVTPETIDIAISGADNSTEYRLASDLSGETVSYTTDASATATELRDGLIADWNANPLYRAAGEAVANGPDIKIELVYPATALNVRLDAGNAAHIAITETAESEPTLAYGVPVYLDATTNRATTTKPAGTVAANIIGISLFDLGTPRDDSSQSQVEKTRRMLRVLKAGCIGVLNSDSTAAKRDGIVYVGTGAGEENKFYTTTGAGREAQSRRDMVWRDEGSIELKLA